VIRPSYGAPPEVPCLLDLALLSKQGPHGASKQSEDELLGTVARAFVVYRAQFQMPCVLFQLEACGEPKDFAINFAVSPTAVDSIVT